MQKGASDISFPPATLVIPPGESPRGLAEPDKSKRRGMLPPAVGSGLLVAVAAVACALAITLPCTPIRSTLWGLLVLAAMIGYGTALGGCLFPQRALDWGLRAALGLALVLVLGGLLAVFHLVSVASSIAVVLVGLGYLARHEVRRASVISRPGRTAATTRLRRHRPFFVLGTLGLASLLAVRYLMAVGNPDFNPGDDTVAYLEFATQMLGSGTLIEPLSLRRITALGGQSYLDALVLARGAVPNLHVLDDGIALLILAGLVRGYSRRRTRAQWIGEMFALLLLVIILRPSINMASALTGCVCFFGLLRMLREEDAGQWLGWRSAAALALFPAAAVTLRQSHLVAAAVIPTLGLLLFARQVPRADRWAWAGQAVRIALVGVALLVPWWILSLRSCGTFLFPLVVGWGERALMPAIPLVDRLRFVAKAITFRGGMISSPLTFFAAGALMRGRRSQRLVKVFLLGSALGALAIIWGGAHYCGDVWDTSRYQFPVVLPCVLAVCLEAIPALADRRWRERAPVARIAPILTLCAIAIQLHVHLADIPRFYLGRIRLAAAALSTSPIRSEGSDVLYHRIQGVVPPGEKLLVMLDEPYRLDFRRNTIVIFDWWPGSVSPPPGTPLGKGPEALARYLSSLSIRYIAFRVSNRSFVHNITTWEEFAAKGRVWDGYSGYHSFNYHIRDVLDIFASLKGLSQTRHRLFDKDEYLVLDLASPGRPAVLASH
jgi:hypothetical protein